MTTATQETEAAPADTSTPRPPASLDRIVLTGFMGAGKSTVGRLLAAQLGWQFLDIDDAIQAKAGQTVAEIFSTLGEFAFRRLETSAIAHALGERRAIIALGGGAPEVLANRLLLEQTPRTAVLFLQAPLDILWQRCQQQQNAPIRPNLHDHAAAAERLQYRLPLYRRCARHTIDTALLTPPETAALILATLAAISPPNIPTR